MLAPAVLAPVMPARQEHQRNERQHCHSAGGSGNIKRNHVHLLSSSASETFYSQVAYLTVMKRRGRAPKNARRAAATLS